MQENPLNHPVAFFIYTVCAIVALALMLSSFQHRKTNEFKQACEKAGGNAVHNGKFHECIKPSK
jgi:hypothetical protein